MTRTGNKWPIVLVVAAFAGISLLALQQWHDGWPPWLRLFDSPPSAEFTIPPERVDRSRLGLAYKITDDDGVESLNVDIRLPNQDPVTEPDITRIELPIGAESDDRKLIERQSIHDLTSHPWAGLTVEIRLIARDGGGQEGASDWVKLVLPARKFNHAVARAILVQRQRLALLDIGSREKIEQDVIVGLDMIKDRASAYGADPTVYLSLSVAQARLTHSQDDNRNATVMDLLWNTAIGLESGRLAVVEKRPEN